MHDFHVLRLFQPTRITNRWPRLRSGSHFNVCEINITHVLLRDKLTGFINVKICACGALELRRFAGQPFGSTSRRNAEHDNWRSITAAVVTECPEI
jgi:hypothetical protein